MTRRAQRGPYPHLVPELQHLRGDALALWGDAVARRHAFEDLLDAWEAGSIRLATAVERIDAAVVQGLEALGLPRDTLLDPVSIVGTSPYEPAGQKFADCRLHLSGTHMDRMVRTLGLPDDSARTWVHESLHARLAYAEDAAREHRPFKGYEEGMAEGLARLIVQEKAGMRPSEASYAYFVYAYRTLTGAFGIDVERLWRELWRFPVGRVRESFPDVVSRLAAERTAPLTSAQQGRLRAVADTLFATSRMNQMPHEGALMAAWRTALR